MSSKLYETIALVLSVPVSKISDDSSPETIQNWDSFHGLVLIDELETVFNIKFTLEEVTNTKTVADIKRNLLNHGVTLFDG